MKPFEEDMLRMIKNMKFKNEFQFRLKTVINKIRDSKKIFVPVNKTQNIYEMEKNQYNKILYTIYVQARRHSSTLIKLIGEINHRRSTN